MLFVTLFLDHSNSRKNIHLKTFHWSRHSKITSFQKNTENLNRIWNDFKSYNHSYLPLSSARSFREGYFWPYSWLFLPLVLKVERVIEGFMEPPKKLHILTNYSINTELKLLDLLKTNWNSHWISKNPKLCFVKGL